MVTSQTLMLALSIAGAGETVLLEFSANWCGPCRSMEPTVRRLVDEGLPIRKIDVDQHPDAAAQYRVTGLPSFVMVTNGRETDRVLGPTSYARLRQMFKQPETPPQRPPLVRGQSPDQARRRGGLFGRARGSAHRASPPPAATLDIAIPKPSVAPQSPHAPPGNVRERKNESPVDRALAATVRIKVEDPSGHSMGTGTIIDMHGGEVLAVTCGHIFRDSGGKSPITVETFDGTEIHAARGHLISFNLERDIGMVSFAPSHPMTPAPVASSGQSIRNGSDVFSIGCNRGADPTVQRSRITSIDKYTWPPNIEVAGQPVQGRSGGGLFTAAGELIGICNFADPTDNEGIYASLATIHWELDRIGQRRIYQSKDAPLADLGLAARQQHPPTATAPAARQAPMRSPATPAAPRGNLIAAAHGATDLEVICIVRSRSDPNGPNQVFVLNQPPPELLDHLAGVAQPQRDRELVPVEIARGGKRSPVVRAQSAE